MPSFQDLPESEKERIASRLIYKKHQCGDTLYHKSEKSDRIYVIDHGEVALINPHDRSRKPTIVVDHMAFGEMSFLTGARHTVSTIASEDTPVWVLRKIDFEEFRRVILIRKVS